jgi:hypothetical protein
MTWDVLKKESFMVPPWWVTPLRAAEQNYASLHRTPSARFTDLPITPIDSMASHDTMREGRYPSLVTI